MVNENRLWNLTELMLHPLNVCFNDFVVLKWKIVVTSEIMSTMNHGEPLEFKIVITADVTCPW